MLTSNLFVIDEVEYSGRSNEAVTAEIMKKFTESF